VTRRTRGSCPFGASASSWHWSHVDGSVSVEPHAVPALARHRGREIGAATIRVIEVPRPSEDGPYLLGLWSLRIRRISEQAALPASGSAIHPTVGRFGSGGPVRRHPGPCGKSHRVVGRRRRRHQRGQVIPVRNALSPVTSASLATASHVCDNSLNDLPLPRTWQPHELSAWDRLQVLSRCPQGRTASPSPPASCDVTASGAGPAACAACGVVERWVVIPR